MLTFADAHIHLAALDSQVAEDIAASGREILSVTCSPAEYVDARQRFSSYANAHVALGLHPWRVNGDVDASELEAFLALAPRERFIGEIGLDFYKERAAAKDEQLHVFTRVCDTLSREQHVVSLHSRGAAKELLDVLERYELPRKSICILHAYNGPSDQMSRALKMGCYFSLGCRELATKRGREYARQLPHERLLFETDADGTRPFSCKDWEFAIDRFA